MSKAYYHFRPSLAQAPRSTAARWKRVIIAIHARHGRGIGYLLFACGACSRTTGIFSRARLSPNSAKILCAFRDKAHSARFAPWAHGRTSALENNCILGVYLYYDCMCSINVCETHAAHAQLNRRRVRAIRNEYNTIYRLACLCRHCRQLCCSTPLAHETKQRETETTTTTTTPTTRHR